MTKRHLTQPKWLENPQFLTLFDFQLCFAPLRRAVFRHRSTIWSSKTGPNMRVIFSTFHENVLGATTACTVSTSHCPEVARTCGNFNIFHENVLGATTACTFSTISTSKSPSDAEVFCHFLLRNMLRATTACTFSTSQLPKVVRDWCVLYILTIQMCFAPQTACTFP